jgi:hypothetical protein
LDFYTLEQKWVPAGLDGDVDRGENLYTISSETMISDSVIARMLGGSFNNSLSDLGVRWVHRQEWPLGAPRRVQGPSLDRVELTDGLFYTGISDELLPTMEMSCRMGSAIAELAFQRLRGQQRQHSMYPFI